MAINLNNGNFICCDNILPNRPNPNLSLISYFDVVSIFLFITKIPFIKEMNMWISNDTNGDSYWMVC